jgi:hypothetical protein
MVGSWRKEQIRNYLARHSPTSRGDGLGPGFFDVDAAETARLRAAR